MKVQLRRWSGLILIFVGVFLIGSVCLKKIKTDKRQEELQMVLQNVVKDKGSEGVDSSNIPNVEGFKPIALMEIPSIKLSQGIVSGVNDEALQYYLGHFENSALPGEKGNFSVAGHRVSDYSDAFVNLYKVKIGEDIIVKSKGKKFTYKIDNILTVSPDRIDVLDETNSPTITLVTCTLGASERLIVKGALISTEEI